MANRKQSSPQEKPPSRTRLLDAALHLIRAKGYAATAVDDICQRAGVTKGSFFHHFKSKDDLALAAVAHWESGTASLFAAVGYHQAEDPLDRLLGYLDFRGAILSGELADYTCLLGTLVQETYATHPEIRAACERALSAHTAELTRDVEAAKQLYAPTAPWSAESVGNFIQAVLQGSFILAKAKQGPEVVHENLVHLRHTLRVLFQPDSYSDPAKAVEFTFRTEAPDSPVKKKDRQQPAFHPNPVEKPEAELEPEEEYDSRLSHFVD